MHKFQPITVPEALLKGIYVVNLPERSIGYRDGIKVNINPGAWRLILPEEDIQIDSLEDVPPEVFCYMGKTKPTGEWVSWIVNIEYTLIGHNVTDENKSNNCVDSRHGV